MYAIIKVLNQFKLGIRLDQTCFRSTELNFCRRNALKSIVPGGFPIPTNTNLKFSTAGTTEATLWRWLRQGTNLLQVEEKHCNHPNGPSHFSICSNVKPAIEFNISHYSKNIPVRKFISLKQNRFVLGWFSWCVIYKSYEILYNRSSPSNCIEVKVL